MHETSIVWSHCNWAKQDANPQSDETNTGEISVKLDVLPPLRLNKTLLTKPFAWYLMLLTLLRWLETSQATYNSNTLPSPGGCVAKDSLVQTSLNILLFLHLSQCLPSTANHTEQFRIILESTCKAYANAGPPADFCLPAKNSVYSFYNGDLLWLTCTDLRTKGWLI